MVSAEAVKFFPSHLSHTAAPISDSLALSYEQTEAASPWTRGQRVARCACLLPSLRYRQFILLGV